MTSRTERRAIGSALDLELLLIEARHAVANSMSVARDLDIPQRSAELRATARQTIQELDAWLLAFPR